MRQGQHGTSIANEEHAHAHGGHGKIKPFAKLLIAMECPFYSFNYNFRYMLGPKGSFFTEMSAPNWTYHTNISIFVCCVLAVVLGVVSDSYFSKYYTLLIGFAICLVSSVIIFVAAVAQLGPLEKTLNTIGLFWMCLYLVIEPLRFGFFIDQLPPQMVPHQLGHVFLSYQEMKTLGSIVCLAANRFLGSKVYGETPLSLALLYFMIPILYTIVIASLYKFVDHGDFQYSIGLNCITCFVHAFNMKFIKGEKNDGHWMETARDAFDSKTLRSTKIMSSLIFIYMTLFSYGMTSSLMRQAWNDQVKNLIEDMDLKNYYVDVNIIYFALTIMFLPMIEYFLLPFVNKYRKNPLTELQRIGITVFLTGISFISTTIVQLEMEKYTTLMPSPDYAQVRIFNIHDENVRLSGDWNFPPTTIEGHGHIGAWNVISQEISLYTMTIQSNNTLNYTTLMVTKLGESLSYLIGNEELLLVEGPDPIHFGPQGTNKDDHVRIYLINYSDNASKPLMPEGEHVIFTDHDHSYTEKVPSVGDRSIFQVRPGEYSVTCRNFGKLHSCGHSMVNLQRGGLYAILPHFNTNRTLSFKSFTILNPAKYSAVVIVPQIALLSFAEAMGKIPINMFIFKESPLALRSSSIAMYTFFRDSSAIIFAIFHEVFRYQIDSFQLVLVTGVHMVFCFLYVYAALRHQKYPEEDMMKRRRAIMKSN